MFRDSYRHRRKYYITLLTTIYVVIFAICALVIAANWKYVKILFTPIEKEISLEQKQFNDLFIKVKYLEDLSKKYNENDYQLRAVKYIRSAQYPDSAYGDLLGESDPAFESYVINHQGDKKVSLLKSMGADFYFTNPKTKQKVNFYGLFANLNAMLVQDQDVSDAMGWGGYICELALSYSDSDLTGDALYNAIKTSMLSNGTFGEQDRCDDFDAVNIYNQFVNDRFSYDSIYLSAIKYYSVMDKESEVDNFKSYLSEKENQELEDEIYSRLQQNIYIQIMSDGYNFDFPDIGENEEYSRAAEIYKACIKVYVGILKA